MPVAERVSNPGEQGGPQAGQPVAGDSKSWSDRIVGSLTASQKVLTALAGLIVAAGAVWAAVAAFGGSGQTGASPSPTAPISTRTSATAAVQGDGSSGIPIKHIAEIDINDSAGLDVDPADDGNTVYYTPGLNEVFGGSNALFALLPPGRPGTYAGCRDDGDRTATIGLDSVAPGQVICLTTSTHRIAALTTLPVDSATHQAGNLAIEVTVWQGP